MIYNAPPFLSIDGVVVLRDHANPRQFYCYPGNPRLALNPDGSPCFNFVRFRRDLANLPPGVEAGGGFLNFDVDLRIDDDVLNGVKRKLQQDFNLDDLPDLAKIQFKNGRTRLIFLDAPDQTGAGTPPATTSGPAGATSGAPAAAGSTPPATPPPGAFVEKASYPATPSLYGDERTAFSVQLSADAATLVEDTLDMKTSLIGVVYDLTYVALRPAFDVELTIDWNRVYDDVDQHFGANVHAWYVTAGTDISDEVEKLIENQVIQLKVTSFAAGAGDEDIEKQKEAAVEFVKKYITDQFFTPSYTPPSGVAATAKQAPQVAAPSPPKSDATGTAKQAPQAGAPSPPKSDATGTAKQAPQAGAPSPPKSDDAGTAKQAPQGGAPSPPKSDDAGTAKQAPQGGAPSPPKSDAAGTAKQAPQGGAPSPPKSDAAGTAKQAPQGGGASSPPGSDVAGTVKGVREALAPSSPVGVTLSYTYKHMHREDVKHLNLSIHEQDAMEMRIVPQGHLQGMMDVLAQFPREAYVRDVDLNDDFFKTVRIDVVTDQAFAADQIDQMKVHFEYAGEPKDLVFSAPGATAQAIWTYDKDAGNEYTYQYEVLFKDSAPQGQGKSVKSPVMKSKETKLVLPDELYTIQNIAVQAVNIPFDRYTQVEVELSYADPDNKISFAQTYLLNATNQSPMWRIRVADPANSDYNYRLTHYPVGKPPIAGDWKTTSAPALIVTDPYPNVLRVTVLPALDFTKVQRALVTLSYADDANHISQTDLLPPLAGPDAVAQWTCNIADGTKRTYMYQVDAQYKDGSVKEYPAVPCTDRTLFVSDSYRLPVKVSISATGSFAAASLNAVSVALTYDDAPNNNHVESTIRLTPTSSSGEFDFTIMDPQKTRYSYIVTYETTDVGFNRTDAQATSDSTNLQIPLQTAIA